MTTATINCAHCKHGYADTALFCPNCGRPKARAAEHDPLIGKLLGERFQVVAMLAPCGLKQPIGPLPNSRDHIRIPALRFADGWRRDRLTLPFRPAAFRDLFRLRL